MQGGSFSYFSAKLMYKASQGTSCTSILTSFQVLITLYHISTLPWFSSTPTFTFALEGNLTKVAYHVRAEIVPATEKASEKSPQSSKWMNKSLNWFTNECFVSFDFGGISVFLKSLLNQTTWSFQTSVPILLFWGHAENKSSTGKFENLKTTSCLIYIFTLKVVYAFKYL